MDVKKIMWLFCLSFFVANCNKEAPQTTETFQKAETDECQEAQIQGEYLVHWKNGQVSIESFPDDESFIEDFIENHRDEILTSEPHYRIEIEQRVAHLSSVIDEYENWGVDFIGARKVWDKMQPRSEIIVAVIDSGVDIEHPELVDAIYTNPHESINGEDDDNNGLVDDVHGYDFVADSHEIKDYTGHGTHVTGTIAAQHEVGKVLGVAPHVKILPIAFISRGGGGTVNSAVNSIRYAAKMNSKVINASWGSDFCSFVLKREIEALAAQDILFVTAAGNRTRNIDFQPEYPAAFIIDNMITVGASALNERYDDDGNPELYQLMASFTNYGDLVDLMAPGAMILSTYPTHPMGDDDKNDDAQEPSDPVAFNDGTSMAAPHVSGAAALLWSLHPEATYGEIKAALLNGVESGPFRVKSRGSLYLPEALDWLELSKN